MVLEVHLRSLLTSATEMCGQPYAATPSPPGTDLPASNKYEAGWDPKSVRTFWRREKILAPVGI